MQGGFYMKSKQKKAQVIRCFKKSHFHSGGEELFTLFFRPACLFNDLAQLRNFSNTVTLVLFGYDSGHFVHTLRLRVYRICQRILKAYALRCSRKNCWTPWMILGCRSKGAWTDGWSVSRNSSNNYTLPEHRGGYFSLPIELLTIFALTVAILLWTICLVQRTGFEHNGSPFRLWQEKVIKLNPHSFIILLTALAIRGVLILLI